MGATIQLFNIKMIIGWNFKLSQNEAPYAIQLLYMEFTFWTNPTSYARPGQFWSNALDGVFICEERISARDATADDPP